MRTGQGETWAGLTHAAGWEIGALQRRMLLASRCCPEHVFGDVLSVWDARAVAGMQRAAAEVDADFKKASQRAAHSELAEVKQACGQRLLGKLRDILSNGTLELGT